MIKRRKLSDSELEHRLKADAADPNAWEHVATIPASKSSRPVWYGRSKPAGNIEAIPSDEVFARLGAPYDSDYCGVERGMLRYLSDDERYDSQFPEHPLSRVRRTLDMLLENVFIESR